jgi:hypothetical protein
MASKTTTATAKDDWVDCSDFLPQASIPLTSILAEQHARQTLKLREVKFSLAQWQRSDLGNT